jgi:DNA-binding transcriptional ArsR family regulator
MSMTVEIAQARVKRLVDSGARGSCRPRERLLQLDNRVKMIDESAMRRLESFFSALGDLTRLRIVKMIGDEELCSCEVMAALDLTQPTTSHHLGILERGGVLSSRREGKWVFYRIANHEIRSLLEKSPRLLGDS